MKIMLLKPIEEEGVIEYILQDWLGYELDVHRGKSVAESRVFYDAVAFAREIGHNPIAERYVLKKAQEDINIA